MRGLGEERRPIDLKVEFTDGERDWISLIPSDRLVKSGVSEFATIGVRPTDSTTLLPSPPVFPYMAAGQATPALQPGDRIVGVGSEPFATDRANERGDFPADAVESELAARSTSPITFLVEREAESTSQTAAPQRLAVTVPPQPMRRVGIEMRIGPIEAVREDSPAARAGFQTGDRITAVRSQAVGDPILLPQRLERWIGEEVTIKVERPDETGSGSSELELVVVPEPRFQFTPAFGPSSLVGAESIGIAYAVENQVAGVEPGSPADLAGLHPDDVLTEIQFEPRADEAKALVSQFFGRDFDTPIKFDDQQLNWPFVSECLQSVPPETNLLVHYLRGDQELTATLKPVTSEQWFSVDRGFRFRPLERIHLAESWGEAWRLGVRETKETLLRVFNFLGALFTMACLRRAWGGR